MKCLHQMVLLLTCTFVLCQRSGTNARFKELKNLLNGTCSTPIPCKEKEDYKFSTRCKCGPTCVRHGTCCVDSPHRLIPSPKVNAPCRSILGSADKGYFMVDQCPQQSDGSKSIYEDLCIAEWNGQNDVMRLVPVTSLVTKLLYKNYFCFRCHESGDDYVFWNVNTNFKLETEVREKCGKVQLKYDNFNRTWSAPVGPGCSLVPVTIDMVSPQSVKDLNFPCKPFLISKCRKNWQNESVRTKCNSYLYRTLIIRDNEYLEYRNPHCVLCNYVSLDSADCPLRGISVYSITPSTGDGVKGGGKRTFSFEFLLDINRSDGDRVGQRLRCRGNDVWDPFFKKCRTLKCALQGYTVQNSKCIRP